MMMMRERERWQALCHICDVDVDDDDDDNA